MSRLRIIALAPSCDPTDVSVPFVTYRHAAALAKLHDVTLVIGSPVEARVRSARAEFRSIEVVRMPALERVWDWSFQNIFKSNYDSQVLAAFRYPFAIAFEWQPSLAWAVAVLVIVAVGASHLGGKVIFCTGSSSARRIRSRPGLSVRRAAYDRRPSSGGAAMVLLKQRNVGD